MLKRWLFLAAGVLFAIAALVACWWCWDAFAIPTEPEQLTLYSIDGREPRKPQAPEPPQRFYGHPVLGKVEVADAAQRREIMRSLRWGVAEHTPMTMAGCFWPRHAIRIVAGGRTIDYVICFECRQVEVRQGDSCCEVIGMTRSPQPLFNKVLHDAGVPIVPSAIPGLD
jgi:hypothetical protein